jgi:radical SAM superfamily enzyme YgiQ (UPF0313 family)
VRISLIYPRLSRQLRSFLVPLGLISLGTVLEEDGHEVRLLDSSFDADTKAIRKRLETLRPEMAGFSCSTDLYPEARDLISFAKSLGARTVIGGPHATIHGEALLEENPSLDIIIHGEGEITLRQLARALEGNGAIDQVPGLVLRSEGRIIRTTPREWIEDLDTLPIPRRSLLPTYGKYSASGYTGLVLSRGCPFSCRFCQPALGQVAGKFRHYSARRVADEIEHLFGKYGNRKFHIDDDLFVLDRKWVAEIADELAARKLPGDLRFILLCRVDSFDDDLARTLKRLGAWYLMFGVESGAQEVLDAFHKKIRIESTKEAFARARRFGFRTHAFVILGSPYETPETLRQTEALIDELNPDSLFLSRYVPMPGTAIREELEAEGRVDIRSLEQVNYFNWEGAHLLAKNDKVTFEEVLRTRDRLLGKRRLRFILFNAVEAVRDFAQSPSPARLALLTRFYLKKRDFNG